ncbi:hypothetical protein PVAND_003340 [Polypedilum vanderplanki]|uniref:Cuticular protein n=1 Tax=Polypedilum vanderplanki TaxID=319348 RepID=A0A9J6BU94_POLVA|nr:hypothetical protein PVAND_003340 [Polypedilum vanderplanki]
MMKLSFAVLFCVACSCYAQKQNTTPVPILKQINRHNEDGSYSYGYEAADGSFKIETKSTNGEVKGKYGYIDADGNLREISYGADANGFSPSGTDINVPPPTIHNDRDSLYQKLRDGEIDDGQYREDPAIYLDPKYNSKPSSKAAAQFTRFNQSPAPKPFVPAQNYQYQTTPAPYIEPQTQKPFYQTRFQAPLAQNNYYQPEPQPQQYYQPQPQPQNYYKPSYNNNNYYRPAPQTPHDIFQGHPATNFDINTGSYSVNYVG